MLSLDGPKISDAAADIRADVFGNIVGYLQSTAFDRFVGSGNRVMDEGAHLAGFLLFDIVQRVEIFYFAGKSGGKPGSVELLDIVRSTLAFQKRGPGGLECIAYRRNQTETGNDDATIQSQDSFRDRLNKWLASLGLFAPGRHHQ